MHECIEDYKVKELFVSTRKLKMIAITMLIDSIADDKVFEAVAAIETEKEFYERHVYCTDCINFKMCDEELPYCKHENKCNINDCEDSRPFEDRPYYKQNIGGNYE